jgi:ComF family protein
VQPYCGYLQHNKHNKHMFEQIISFIAPHTCLNCQKEGSLLCYECQAALPAAIVCYRCGLPSGSYNICNTCSANAPFQKMFAVTPYEGTGKALVHKIKFNRAKGAALPLAQCLARRLPSEISARKPLIMHIPTATSRIRMRGYDQAALVAAHFAQISESHHTPLLRRHGQQRQLGKGRSERLQQMQHRFYLACPILVEGKDIILIDDVVTTGATMDVAAFMLKQAGAQRVYGLVFALA